LGRGSEVDDGVDSILSHTQLDRQLVAVEWRRTWLEQMKLPFFW
jgi:hypothetical protein